MNKAQPPGGTIHKRKSVKVFRMRDEFKLAALKAANREGVSLESFIRLSMAKRMGWNGEI